MQGRPRRNDGVFREVVAALADGSVLLDRERDEGTLSGWNLYTAAGHVVWATGADQPPRVWRSDWVDLPFCGTLRQVGSAPYGIGHDEVLRLNDDFSVAARVALEVPPPSHDHPSVAIIGDDLWVLSRATEVRHLDIRELPVVDYCLERRDPKTLAPRGEAAQVRATFATEVLGHREDVLVLRTGGRFAAAPLPL